MPAQASLDAYVSQRLFDLDAKSLRRRLAESDRARGHEITRGGKQLISFSCNDYLGLSHHPKVIEAAVKASETYGTGAGASRLVTGNHPLFTTLEARLAAYKDTEDAVIFGSGYLANLGTISALMRPGDLILVDELAHNCIHAGAQAARATVLRFRHNNLGHLQDLLETRRREAKHCLIATDGVFSMDGDLAPLPDILALATRFDAWTLVDDAHGLGTVAGGKGASDAFDPPAKAPLQMGTLSKALGSYGGYVCASRVVCEFLRNRARSLIYTTGLPPSAIAAALAALDVMADEPERVARPLALARQFCAAVNLPAAQSPVVPVVLGTPEAALNASATLEEAGFLVTAIRPPTVPEGTARLRIAFGADHTEEQTARLAELVRPMIERGA